MRSSIAVRGGEPENPSRANHPVRRVGVVSDTHNHLSNVTRIVELLNDAGVDAVVHTGDVTQAKTLRVLAGLAAPLLGVWGNNDLERESLDAACAEHGFYFVDGVLELLWSDRRVFVVHDPIEIDDAFLTRADVILHGHVHRRVEKRAAGTLVFNPGECAGHMKGLNAIGIVDLQTLECEILRF